MSLKAFHLLFVTVSTILALGFAFWALNDYRNHGTMASLIAGLLSLGIAGSLVFYGRWFMQKLKGVKCV